MTRSLLLTLAGVVWLAVAVATLMVEGALLDAAQSLSIGLLMILASDRAADEAVDRFPN